MIEKIKELYLDNPCYLSSIAFWKLDKFLKESEMFEIKKDNTHVIYAMKDDQLIFYWSNNKEEFILQDKTIHDFNVMILHEDYVEVIKDKIQDFKKNEMYPLIFEGEFHEPVVPENYYLSNFNFNDDSEYQKAADFINHIYNHHHHADEIKSWTEEVAFEPSLWFWVKEKETNECAALAISTYQQMIKETYLDWIQASSNHKGKGIGRLLIDETIKRTKEKDIIRVTGIADDFYKKCGFVSRERWFYLSKQTQN